MFMFIRCFFTSPKFSVCRIFCFVCALFFHFQSKNIDMKIQVEIANENEKAKEDDNNIIRERLF